MFFFVRKRLCHENNTTSVNQKTGTCFFSQQLNYYNFPFNFTLIEECPSAIKIRIVMKARPGSIPLHFYPLTNLSLSWSSSSSEVTKIIQFGSMSKRSFIQKRVGYHVKVNRNIYKMVATDCNNNGGGKIVISPTCALTCSCTTIVDTSYSNVCKLMVS